MKQTFGFPMALTFVVSACGASMVSADGVASTKGLVIGQSQEAPMALAAEHARAMLNINFQRFDCENSGLAHVDEVDDHFAQIWLPADRDQNRTLSPTEYRRTHTSLGAAAEAALFADADANGDGQIAANEMRWHLRRLMRLADANGDAAVSLAEAGLPPDPYALSAVLDRKRRAAESQGKEKVKEKVKPEEAAAVGNG